MIQDQIDILFDWVKDSNNIVFFGGAGVSTESGIPDFRSTDGVYHMKYNYPPETILSHRFFMNQTLEFYEFYRDKMVYKMAAPNITHFKLQELEEEGKLQGIITQNIDGLHQKAGSKKVIELHGSIHQNYCLKCGASYELDYMLEARGIPYCSCGGKVKPNVVLYEESLNQGTIAEAVKLITDADLLIIGGTSLSVYPAAGLIEYYTKNKIVLINKSVTPLDQRANLLINGTLGEVFSLL